LNQTKQPGTIGTDAGDGHPEVAARFFSNHADPRWQNRLLLLAFCLAFVLSAAYMYSWAKDGWLAQDDGTLAQSALRVLRGELPHRDFPENYTGGLDYVNAWGFKAFGINLVALRVVMFMFFLAWVPALFYVASRFGPPLAAAAVTLLAVAWSVPNYPTPMPSWYNLFFATMGAAALLRYLEAGTWPWLFLAGVFGGLSFAVKIVGLYYVAAVLLWFVFREQELNEENPGQSSRSSYLYRSFAIVSLAAFLAVLGFMLRKRLSSADIVHFLVPSLAIVVALVVLELRRARKGNQQRFRVLFSMIVPFAAGYAVPNAVLLAPYIWSSSLPAFSSGVFAEGMKRAAGLSVLGPVGIPGMLYAVPLLALVGAAIYWKRASRTLATVVVGASLTGLLVYGHHHQMVLRDIWLSVSQITPIIVLAGAVVLVVQPRFADGLSKLRRQQLMLLLAIAALCSIVQFPFAAPIYFSYCSPLVILAVVALIAVRKAPANRGLLAVVLAFYALFAVVEVAPSRIYSHWYFTLGYPVQTFRIPRAAGLRGEYVANYEAAAQVIREHATNDLLIATAECPDLYFLTGLQNPTTNDNGLTSEELLRVLPRPDVNVVAINTGSTFSGGEITQEVVQELKRQFPNSVRVGKYWIGWRH
jgi:hypothetical protein